MRSHTSRQRGLLPAAFPTLFATVFATLLAALPQLAWSAPDAGSVLQQLEARPGQTLFAPQL